MLSWGADALHRSAAPPMIRRDCATSLALRSRGPCRLGDRVFGPQSRHPCPFPYGGAFAHSELRPLFHWNRMGNFLIPALSRDQRLHPGSKSCHHKQMAHYSACRLARKTFDTKSSGFRRDYLRHRGHIDWTNGAYKAPFPAASTSVLDQPLPNCLEAVALVLVPVRKGRRAHPEFQRGSP